MFWQTTRFCIDLSRPVVMGIVNVTPDSFSDGGLHADGLSALRHCERLVAQGAGILDIGGESSRPGAPSLSEADEWSRIEDVLRAALSLGVPVSVDTCKTGVMARAVDLGVDIINDIRALQDEGAVALIAAQPRLGCCLMHMRGSSATMQSMTNYRNVVAEVEEFLLQRTQLLASHGISRDRIVLDPGYGFAKTAEQNFELLRMQGELLRTGFPILAGWSRKSALGHVTGRDVAQRMPASISAALLAAMWGARILRVHDVAETMDALKVWQAAGAPDLIGENGAISSAGGRTQ